MKRWEPIYDIFPMEHLHETPKSELKRLFAQYLSRRGSFIDEMRKKIIVNFGTDLVEGDYGLFLQKLERQLQNVMEIRYPTRKEIRLSREGFEKAGMRDMEQEANSPVLTVQALHWSFVLGEFWIDRLVREYADARLEQHLQSKRDVHFGQPVVRGTSKQVVCCQPILETWAYRYFDPADTHRTVGEMSESLRKKLTMTDQELKEDFLRWYSPQG